MAASAKGTRSRITSTSNIDNAIEVVFLTNVSLNIITTLTSCFTLHALLSLSSQTHFPIKEGYYDVDDDDDDDNDELFLWYS